MQSTVQPNSIFNLSNRSETKRVFALSILGGMALVVLIISILTGPVEIPISAIWQGLKRTLGADPTAMSGSSAIVSVIRLPRVFLGVFVGAALGISGAALQGLFRNPLVDPGLIGVSSGGALLRVFQYQLLVLKNLQKVDATLSLNEEEQISCQLHLLPTLKNP